MNRTVGIDVLNANYPLMLFVNGPGQMLIDLQAAVDDRAQGGRQLIKRCALDLCRDGLRQQQRIDG